MARDRAKLRRWGRWTGTFIAFPLAGVAARAVAGDIDALGAATVGGLAGGAVLGALQVGIGGIEAFDRVRWIAATAGGLAVGLPAGASAVGYRTDTASLVAMGAISGAAVGLAQALSIPMRHRDRILWTFATPALWAAGWLITSQVIVDAERHHAMFGSSGALMVSALSGVIHVARSNHRPVVAGLAPSSGRVAA
jgi:hypothetical protein